jgi:hypothetical protein
MLIKSELELRFSDSPEWLEDGAKFITTVWKECSMVDEHVAEKFQTLSQLGFFDETDGFMSFFGEMEMEDVKKFLREKDWNIGADYDKTMGEEDTTGEDLEQDDHE